MRPSTTARRYAEAAFQVARADDAVSTWLEHLRAASRVVDDQRVAQYFKDPAIAVREKIGTIDEMFGGYPTPVTNLMRLLAVNQRMHLLSPITREFEDLDKQNRGVAEAEVTVARPMTDDERQEIAHRLQQITGKTVEITAHVDPRILGGIVIRIGDKLIDASVAGRLERLRQNLVV